MNSLLIPQLKYPLGVLPNQRAKYLEDKEKDIIKFIKNINAEPQHISKLYYLKTKKLLSVFPLFMTNMLSFLRTRLPTISCLYVNHITSNA